MKVLVVFGTRPEAIKMCPVINAIQKSKEMECKVCVTGQHKEMLQQVLDVFGVIPDYDLSIMKKNQTLYDITYAVMEGIRTVLEKVKPQIVLVHGDTTTTFAVSLACFYERIPVGHVEAGLRTYEKYSPYPEEFNRQAVDIIADLYFAPTECSRQNLIKEGKEEKRIFVTGNTAIDALKTTVVKDYTSPLLDWAKDSKLILLTAHRRENWGYPLEEMLNGVKKVVEDNKEVKVIYPVHYNPVVQETAKRILGNDDRVKMIEPLNVIEFHNLLACAYLVLTDSGGIQEEAPSLGKPVLVMRDTTERPEGIEAGTLKLIGTKKEVIYKEANLLLHDETEYNRMSQAVNPYGDGTASMKIVKQIEEWGKGNDYRRN